MSTLSISKQIDSQTLDTTNYTWFLWNLLFYVMYCVCLSEIKEERVGCVSTRKEDQFLQSLPLTPPHGKIRAFIVFVVSSACLSRVCRVCCLSFLVFVCLGSVIVPKYRYHMWFYWRNCRQTCLSKAKEVIALLYIPGAGATPFWSGPGPGPT